jgi:diadenosine tetraphosphatase ApaH/serine/threonine PP2A family protein phosphatase
MQIRGPVALVHASPESPWRSYSAETGDAELESVYGSLGQPIVVYGHIHCPYVRRVGRTIVANSGSVGLPYDGDRRAAYLLIDDDEPTIRRVEYDVDRELKALSDRGRPHAAWVAKMLEIARACMPPA